MNQKVQSETGTWGWPVSRTGVGSEVLASSGKDHRSIWGEFHGLSFTPSLQLSFGFKVD